jgi:hypothetical protein
MTAEGQSWQGVTRLPLLCGRRSVGTPNTDKACRSWVSRSGPHSGPYASVALLVGSAVRTDRTRVDNGLHPSWQGSAVDVKNRGACVEVHSCGVA